MRRRFTIAVISMRDAWGRSRYTPLMEAFQNKGIKPVLDEEMAPDANDATAQVLRLKAANADAVIIVLYPKPAAIFSASRRFSPRLGKTPTRNSVLGIGWPTSSEACQAASRCRSSSSRSAMALA